MKILSMLLLVSLLISCSPATQGSTPLETAAEGVTATETPAQSETKSEERGESSTPLVDAKEETGSPELEGLPFVKLTSDHLIKIVENSQRIHGEVYLNEGDTYYSVVKENGICKALAIRGQEEKVLYQAPEGIDWLQLKMIQDNWLYIVEKRSDNREGGIFRVSVSDGSKERIGEWTSIYHGPMTSPFVQYQDGFLMIVDDENQQPNLYYYNQKTGELSILQKHAFDLRKDEDHIYFLSMDDKNKVQLKVTKMDDLKEVATYQYEDMEIYHYFVLEKKIHLLAYVAQGENFHYFKIVDDKQEKKVEPYILYNPLVFKDDLVLGNSDHHDIILYKGNSLITPDDKSEEGLLRVINIVNDKVHFSFKTKDDEMPQYYLIDQKVFQDLVQEFAKK